MSKMLPGSSPNSFQDNESARIIHNAFHFHYNGKANPADSKGLSKPFNPHHFLPYYFTVQSISLSIVPFEQILNNTFIVAYFPCDFIIIDWGDLASHLINNMQRGEENIKFFLRCFIFFSIALAGLQEGMRVFTPQTMTVVEENQKQTINSAKPEPREERQARVAAREFAEKGKSEEGEKYQETPVLLVQYCTSWSYGKAFEQLKEKIGYLRPEILVIGEAYPLPPLRSFLSKTASMVQTGLIFLGIGGAFIPAINQHPLYQRFQ